MCWNDFVAVKDNMNHKNKDGDSSTDNMLDKIAQRESQDSLGKLPSHSTINVSDKTNLLGRDGSDKRLADLVENPIVVPKKRHPLTLKRTMSERTLDRGRPMNFLSLLSERVHHEKANKIVVPPTTTVITLPQPSPTHQPSLSPSLTPKAFNLDIGKPPVSPSSPSPTSAVSPTTTSALNKDRDEIKEEPVGDLCSLEGVERMLEAARDNVQAALNKNETKRREAVWDLFQSECTFLYDHLMVLKNVSNIAYCLLELIGIFLVFYFKSLE